MEFACGFVYVPPIVTQKDKQRLMKRSALLPPAAANWKRPIIPPPPPPNSSAEAKSPKSLLSPPKFIEQLEKNKEAKQVVKLSPFYENAAFHKKTEEASSVSVTPQHTPTPRRKTALLPPHMRPPANSQSPPYSEPFNSSNTTNQTFFYDLPEPEPDLNAQPWDPDYSYTVPEGTGAPVRLPTENSNISPQTLAPPPLPPRPSNMKLVPEYLMVLPTSTSSSQKSPSAPPVPPSPPRPADKSPLQGNPNVMLVSLGKLISEEQVQIIPGEPSACSQCGSVLDSCYDNMVDLCYFCQPWESTSSPSSSQSLLTGYQDGLFLLNPQEKLQGSTNALLLFCIDISGSMSITSQVLAGEEVFHRSRLYFLQEAVLQCVQMLSEQQPDLQVGLITFNNQVTLHGYENFTSHFLSGAELADVDYLKKAAASFPAPPPLSHTKDYLQRQVRGLSESGTTALGPAALLAITMASRQPGSKVIICTDGKANTDLGNLEVEDDDARTLLSSTIFYQDLGDYAANQGVTVSVLSIEGTDCRLDELGRLADRTGGKVVIASPNMLHPEFEQIIKNRTTATHCTVTLLLPQPIHVRGERQSGHIGTREVGNVDPDTEITFQFGASEHDAEVSALTSGSRVSIQLQVRYRQRNGQRMLRVITAEREVTDDSSAALSSLSLAIIQLNSSQASAALAVRGRFLDARREGELQRKLIERAIEHNRSAEDKETYQEWVKTMEPIYNNIHNFTRRNSVVSDAQFLTDAGAVLLYNMKHCNRKSISLKNKQKL